MTDTFDFNWQQENGKYLFCTIPSCSGAHSASYTRKFLMIFSRGKLRVEATQAPLSSNKNEEYVWNYTSSFL